MSSSGARVQTRQTLGLDTSDSVVFGSVGANVSTSSVAPAALGGAPVRALSAVFDDAANVKDFGALGDGTTDDSAAIQAAFAASDNVYFPPGTYRITQSITKTGGYWRIHGAGQYVTTIKAETGNDPAFEFDNGGGIIPYVFLEGMTVDGDADRASGALVDFLDPVIQGGVRDIHLRLYYIGIKWNGGSKVFIECCRSDQSGRTGGTKGYATLLLSGDATAGRCADFHISNVQFSSFVSGNTDDSGASFHIAVEAVDGLYIENSHFFYSDYVIRFLPANVTDFSDVCASLHCVNCYFDTSSYGHVSFTGSAGSYRNFIFANCTFRDARGSSGVSGAVTVSADIRHLRFTQCLFRTNEYSGILTTGSNAVTDFAAIGNLFHDCNQADNANAEPLRGKFTGAAIIGNDFVDGSTVANDVQVDSGSTGVRIALNGFGRSNVTTHISDSGTGTIITANGGWASDAQGVANVTTDANGEATIAHGLRAAPTWAEAAYWADTATEVMVVSSDATNVTVRVRNTTTNADQASSTLDIHWRASV